MKTRTHLAIIVSLVAVSSPALAAPPLALFDLNKEITLAGSVREFQWTNPNSWIELDAVGPDGKPAAWSVEHVGRNRLIRQGWKSTSLKAGDQVTLRVHPLKSGEPGGLFISAAKADGVVLD